MKNYSTEVKKETAKDRFDELVKKKLQIFQNSIMDTIEFTDDCGNTIEYELYKLYKVYNKFQFGVIRQVKTGKEFLVTIESIKKMCIYGYINNIYIQSSTDAIMVHKNKLKSNKKLIEFEVETYLVKDEAKVEKLIDALVKRYTCLYEVDNTDIKTISWLRLVPCGLIYDLGRHVCAVNVQDELGNKQTIEINKFIEMGKLKYNEGKFSPRDGHNNFYRVLNYIEISVEDYEKAKQTFGEQSVAKFELHECGEYYRCPVQCLSMNLAFYMKGATGDNCRVYLAVPKPERFESKKYFESALREAKAVEKTRFCTSRYEVTEVEGIDLANASDYLLDRYSELHAGSYIKTYGDIVTYLVKSMHKQFCERSNEIEAELIKVIDAYNKGENIKSMLQNLNVRVMNSDYKFNSVLEKEHVEFKANNKLLTVEECNKYMVEANLMNLAELFNLEHLIIKKEAVEETAEAVKETTEAVEEDIDMGDILESTIRLECDKQVKSESKPLEVLYLTDDCKNKLEVKVEENSNVCVYIVIGNEYIKLEQSEQSYIDYIRNGVNRDSIEKPLKRTMAMLNNDTNITKLLEELI